MYDYFSRRDGGEMRSAKILIAAIASAGFCGTGMAADIPVKAPVYKAPSQALVFGGLAEVNAGIYLYDILEDDPVRKGAAILGGSFAVNIPLAAQFSAQIDGQGEWYSIRNNGDAPIAAGQLGAHLSARDPNKGLLGIFAATTYAREEIGGGHTGGWIAGGEAQLYSGNTTFYAQAGGGRINIDSNEAFRGWFVRGVTRQFTSDDSMVQLDVSYGRTNGYIDGNDWGKFWNWSLKGVQRLPNASPLYGTLEYRGGYYKTSDEIGDRIVEHALIVGLTAKFGAVQSLKHNDRNGATLDLPMLPIRAAARLEALD